MNKKYKDVDFKIDLVNKRGGCEGCGSGTALELHHMLIHKKKGKRKWLDVEYNFMLLCKKCHESGVYNNHEMRVIFWYIQVGRYGYDIMVEWWNLIPLITKPKYNLCTIDSAPTRIKPELLANFANSVVRCLSYLTY